MALGGEDTMEILIQLKDLSLGGFAKLEGSIKHAEATANSANLGGFSKSAKALGQDAEAAAGKGGGGIASLAGGLVGLAGGPVTLAIGALAALTGVGIALTGTYDKVARSEADLDSAFKTHGETMEGNRAALDKLISAGTQYGQGSDDVRGAVLELTQAGHSWVDVQKTMPTVMMLAQQKHIDLATAAKQVELAEMGNAKALKDLGIALPKAGAAAHDVAKAQTAMTTASNNLVTAQNSLKLMEDSLAGKHKLTAAEADRLRLAHDKVTAAQRALTGAQDNLTKAQDTAAASGTQQTVVLDLLNKRLGEGGPHATALEVAQKKLGNAWEAIAVKVGPPLEAVFGAIIGAFATMIDVGGHVIDFVGGLFNWFVKIPEPVRAFMGPIGLLSVLLGHLGDIFGVIATIVSRMIDLFAKLFDAVGKVGKAIADSPVGKFVGTVGGVVGGVGGAIGNVGGFIGGLIPHFASGGVVQPRAGGTLALLGESGEREYVIPESRMGGGRSTIVVQAHLYVDGKELAYTLERPLGSLFALRGTSARLGTGG